MSRGLRRSWSAVAARVAVCASMLGPFAIPLIPSLAHALPHRRLATIGSAAAKGSAAHATTASHAVASHAAPHASVAPHASASATSKASPPIAPSLATAAAKPLVTPSPKMQRAVAGAPSPWESALGAESAELTALREAESEMFLGAAPSFGDVWPSELPTPPKGPIAAGGAGGLPPSPLAPPPVPLSGTSLGTSSSGASLDWLATLKMPDLPIRWDRRVVKYLEFFKSDPRGRRIFSAWYRRSGRYRDRIRETLRARSMPEDLLWLAAAESGFEATIRSAAAAGGLWQFTADSGRAYGLSVDRWADGRFSPRRSTEAAAFFLADLKRRFGSWELALAAYNMGYGGALVAVKRFNTNDYWELSRYENALPWETTHYVPKILALAIVSKNLDAFGYAGLTLDAPIDGDDVDVPAGAELKAIASVAGCTLKEIETLNPELRAGRTPIAERDDDATYRVVVPKGKGAVVADSRAKLAPKGAALERYVVRFGETLDQVALARKTTRAKLVELNGIGADEMIRGGTVLLVPTIAGGSATTKEPFAPPITTAAGSLDGKPVVLIPGVPFHYRDRDRVFYRVLVGDTPRAIADAFSVTLDDLSRWNALDLGARLQDGMALQLFVKKGVDLSRVLAMREPEVRVLAVGSDDFYTYEEAQKGRKRVTVTAKKGDTLESVGKRFGIAVASMEKINRRGREEILKEGDAVIVYVPLAKGEKPVVSGKGDDKKIDEPKAATNPEDSKPGKAKADDAKADDAKADERALDAALSEAKSPEITAPATIEPTAPPAASTAPETSPTSGAAK